MTRINYDLLEFDDFKLSVIYDFKETEEGWEVFRNFVESSEDHERLLNGKSLGEAMDTDEAVRMIEKDVQELRQCVKEAASTKK